MYCLAKLDHYIIPNDVVVMLGKIYRFIGNNDFYIKSLGNDLEKVIEKTIEKDTYYLKKILNLDISEARTKLIIYKNSNPRTKQEQVLKNLKEMITIIQHKYYTMGLQSNDLFNIINMIYSSYSRIEFDNFDDNSYSLFISQSSKSKRVILNKMNDIMVDSINNQKYDKIILSLNYFIDLYNLKPFVSKNEALALLILYQLILNSDLNTFKYVSFFELLFNDYENFNLELCKASVNWKENVSQTIEFVKYFLNLFISAYKNTDEIIKNYLFDKTNKKYENLEVTILSFSTLFTKEDVRKVHPYVSESTINRTLNTLKDKGLIISLGKGRSAKWMKK